MLENFKCVRCGNCCRIHGIVRLKSHEIDEISAHLGMSSSEFIEKNTELSEDRTCLILKERADESCIFLDDGKCSVNQVKPAQCRDFPHEWNNPQWESYCEGFKRLSEAPR